MMVEGAAAAGSGREKRLDPQTVADAGQCDVGRGGEKRLSAARDDERASGMGTVRGKRRRWQNREGELGCEGSREKGTDPAGE